MSTSLALLLVANLDGWFTTKLDWPKLGVILATEIIILILIIKWAANYRARIRKASKTTPPEYKDGQPWRQPAIPFIERIKARVASLEELLLDRHNSRQPKIFRSIWGLVIHKVAYFWGPKYDDSDREEYLRLLDQLDRIWSGDAQLEINDTRVLMDKIKLRRRDCSTSTEDGKSSARSLDEQLIDLERDLRDLEQIVERAKTHPYAEKFEDKKTRRRFDIQDEVFEAFERPFEKEIELRVKFNELADKIRKHPVMSPKEKDELLEELNRRFREHAPKDKKSPISIHRKES